jgi:Icc-related predicted phosphoesterase
MQIKVLEESDTNKLEKKFIIKMIKKILLFSDTHGFHGNLIIPDDIDIAIFAGDAGTYQNPIMNTNGILDFIEWYSSLNIKNKIWIAGNHCTSIEHGLVDAKVLSKEKGLIYLQHESYLLDGLKIFGSPYTPSFGYGWAFNVPRHKLLKYWEEIPEDTNILVTHGGPFGIGDLSVVVGGEDVGCVDLRNIIQNKLNVLKLFCSGHLHEAYGFFQETTDDTLFVNASVLNEHYELVNKPFIVTIDIETKNIINIEN